MKLYDDTGTSGFPAASTQVGLLRVAVSPAHGWVTNRNMPCAQRRGRHRHRLARLLRPPHAVVVDEEERTIALDRSAERAAELVAAQHFFRKALELVEVRIRVERGVPHELVQRAVDAFVPLRVTSSTCPPAERPYSALALLVMTRNSCSASGLTGAFVSSPRGITGSEMSMPSCVVVIPRPRSPLM